MSDPIDPKGWEKYVKLNKPDLKGAYAKLERDRRRLDEYQKAGDAAGAEMARSEIEMLQKNLKTIPLAEREVRESMATLWEKSPSFRKMVTGIYQGPIQDASTTQKRVQLELDVGSVNEQGEFHDTQARVLPDNWHDAQADPRAIDPDIHHKVIFINPTSIALRYRSDIGFDGSLATDGSTILSTSTTTLAHEFGHAYLFQKYSSNPVQRRFYTEVTPHDMEEHRANSEALTIRISQNVMKELGAARVTDPCFHQIGIEDCKALKDPNSALSRHWASLEPALLGPRPNLPVPHLTAEMATRAGEEARLLGIKLASAYADHVITSAEAQEVIKLARPLRADLSPMIDAHTQNSIPGEIPQLFFDALRNKSIDGQMTRDALQAVSDYALQHGDASGAAQLNTAYHALVDSGMAHQQARKR